MKIFRTKDAVSKPPARPDHFEGDVWHAIGWNPLENDNMEANVVTFAPRSRTHWHSHPNGQILVVVSGMIRTQSEGGPLEELGPGDIAFTPPGEVHWHGAGPSSFGVHISLSRVPADWPGGFVTDEVYEG
jgi:quercetin dioxygenase-like cupin family protein